MGDRIPRFGRLRPTLAIALVVGVAGLGYGIVAVWRLARLGEVSVSGVSAEDGRLLWGKHHDEWDKLLADLREARIREADVRDKMKEAGLLDVQYDRRTGVLVATLWQCASLAGCRRGFLEWLPIEQSERRKSVYGAGEGRFGAEVEQLDRHWWLRFE